jgi:hypothetical protein
MQTTSRYFDKNKANIYDAKTITITSLANPIIVAPQCKTTGLWKLDLDADTEVTQKGISTQPTNETVNAIFNLPDNCQTMLYYHALAGFPTKELSWMLSTQAIMPRGQASQQHCSTSIFLTQAKRRRGT